MIGERLRNTRERKRLAREDIEERTGLSHAYVSKVENGEALPSEETVETWARALGISMREILCDGMELPALPNLRNRLTADDIVLGSSRKKAAGSLRKQRA